MEQSAPYFSIRAQQERAAAARSSSTEVRRVHLELAFRYEKLAVDLRQSSGPVEADDRPGPYVHLKPVELGSVIGSAFPLPRSGAFPDLLDAIDQVVEPHGGQ